VSALPEETAASREETVAAREELRDAAAHGVRWSVISRPAIELIQLASIVVLARLIVPAEFGRYAIALIAQEIAFLLVAGGLSAALVQRKVLSRADEQTGMALSLLSGIGLAVATLIAASVVVDPIFGARTAMFVRLMAPLCLVSALSTVPMATLRRRMAFRRLSEIEILSTLVRVGLAVALAIAGLDGEALVLGVIAGSLVTGVIAWASAPPPLPRLHRGPARELLGYGMPFSLASVSWIGFSNVDYAIIGARLGAVQTGFYYRAYTLAVEYQTKVSVVMTQVGFPVLSRTDGPAELAHLHRQMVRMLTILMFPLLALLAIGAPVLVPLMFGSDWSGAVVPVQILAVGGAATLVIDAAGTVLMATGRTRALLGYGVAHFAAYGLAVLIAVSHGLAAVAVAGSAVHTAFLVVAYLLILRGSGERPLRRLLGDVSPATVSSLALVALALPASLGLSAAGLGPIPWLLGVGLVAAPTYLLALRFGFPVVWAEQRGALARIIPWRLNLAERFPRLPLTGKSAPAEVGKEHLSFRP
jgi:lipopolysaccharide exporter